MLKLDREKLVLALQVAIAYLVVDLAIQLTGYLHFGPEIGLKNFLPATLGLFFGLYAVAGTCVASVFGGLLLGTPWQSVVSECLMNAVVGIGLWLLWYRLPGSRPPNFKTWREVLYYIGLTVLLSAVGALACVPLLGAGSFLRLFAAYASLGIVVGLVVNILFSSILWIAPVLPKGYAEKADCVFTLDSSTESLIAFNEQVEDAAMLHKVGMKRVFELESCIEELSIRVFMNLPDAVISGTIIFSDTISIRLRYSGKNYNPFHMGKDEDELDTLSLKLLMHRALRAAHSAYAHQDGENRIHIVL